MNDKGMSVVDFLLIVFLLVAVGGGAWYWQQIKIDDLRGEVEELSQQLERADGGQDEVSQVNFTYTSEKGVEVEVYRPARNERVAGQVAVIGQVPGNWSFEASFPIEVRDEEGNVVGEAPAQLQGDWQTEEMVVFMANIELEDTAASQGTLVLLKANPSDLQENDDSVSFSIQL